MNLMELLQQLCEEFALEPPQKNATKTFSLTILDGLSVCFSDLEPGVALSADLAECPLQKKEEFFLYLMRANFLGQGTGGARIGLSADEKTLTLSLGFSYEVNYQTFKESVEDFTNYVLYWRTEVLKFGTQHGN